ncbi:uncharacterized protein TM35_000321490 [Trypanosoma theileri]|uniref:Uncharacterized protein n=1 Tax=Trypanosoma theileri TaxID=67003 RepID=A0A1X0NM66_9TRYP|nr:uncharacterized protein TM35_000321490 [Trypanosoma theileri]ORC85834.1 hypothetical protein TM35_000321490 [Trypanosoma theileri]
MRREDLLQALLVRFVDPQQEEQDWMHLAALFYSLTGLLLSAQRVEQLYYQHLQSHGGRAAMEMACKEYEQQLAARLQQHIAGAENPACGIVRGGTRRLGVIPSAPPRGGVTAALAPSTNACLFPLGGSGLGTTSLTTTPTTTTAFTTNITTNNAAAASTTGVTGTTGTASNASVVGTGVNSSSSLCGSLASLFTSTPLDSTGGNDDGTFTSGVAFNTLTAEQRERWRRLRQEPISPDILISLVQRFALVETAAVFLAPVHPSTVMEFNGVRSGSYATVIMHPLSLVGIRGRVLASRRDYELHKCQMQKTVPSVGVMTRKRGRTASAASTTSVNEGSGSTNITTGINNSDDDRGTIRTIQELEQAVWQIAANCVVFNAPESCYPFTARQFAVSCTDIIEEYCMQRVLSG